MIKYIKGNLFETTANIICHGVNCKNGFGSGIAGQIKQLYPKVKHEYHKKFGEEGWELGDVQLVKIKENQWIANCATQDSYLPRGICHADYNAIEKCMNIIKELSENKSVAMPLIGCGLAGGSWNIVEKILNKVFDDREIWVYTLD